MAINIAITEGRIAAIVEEYTAVAAVECITAVDVMGSTAVVAGSAEPSVADTVAVGCIAGLVGKSKALEVLAAMVGSGRLVADTGKDLHMGSADVDHHRTVLQAAT